MGNIRQTLMVPDVPHGGHRDSLGVALARALLTADPVLPTMTPAAPFIIAEMLPPVVSQSRMERPAAETWAFPTYRERRTPRSGPMKVKPKVFKGSKAAKKASRARR